LTRVRRTGEVVEGDGAVEPARGNPAAADRYGLFALRDLPRLARRRIVGGADLVDFPTRLLDDALEAGGRFRHDVRCARPLPQFAEDETEVVAGFADAGIALERLVELAARDLELVAVVGDDAGQLRHLRIDEKFRRQLDVDPRLVISLERR